MWTDTQSVSAYWKKPNKPMHLATDQQEEKVSRGAHSCVGRCALLGRTATWGTQHSTSSSLVCLLWRAGDGDSVCTSQKQQPVFIERYHIEVAENKTGSPNVPPYQRWFLSSPPLMVGLWPGWISGINWSWCLILFPHHSLTLRLYNAIAILLIFSSFSLHDQVNLLMKHYVSQFNSIKRWSFPFQLPFLNRYVINLGVSTFEFCLLSITAPLKCPEPAPSSKDKFVLILSLPLNTHTQTKRQTGGGLSMFLTNFQRSCTESSCELKQMIFT